MVAQPEIEHNLHQDILVQW